MPELPQMQALAERIALALTGAAIEAIDPIHFSALKTVSPAPAIVVGTPLEGVGRRGKYLILDAPRARVLVHLSQGGRLVFESPAKRTRPKHGVVRFRFDRDPALFVREYGTERKAAWWVLAPGDDGPLRRLGPEPSDEAFGAYVRTSDDTRRVHTILRDQQTVAGIGRGYADDALHRARLSPYATLASLDAAERARLLEAIDGVLADALAKERTRTGGLPPTLSDHFTVHALYGQPCPICADDLRRVSYESHEVTYCPPCQTGDKVLADRRMSRLVR
jgi:formamidopyrimidine-DNA glycosylase